MALSRLGYFKATDICELYTEAGSASAVVDNRQDIRQILPSASDKLRTELTTIGDHIARAEQEYEWAQKHHVQIICYNDEAYPQRLRNCADAPIVIYYRGTADLNATHMISIVGTRRNTNYGADIIHHFINDMTQLCPDAIIVSGLAYGTDICAHREAMANNMPTIGVLAHGLDTIYPSVHRTDAAKMVKNGGILTEYMSATRPERLNFLQRNRIIAGLSDAVVLVESAIHGGGLVTMRLGQEYGRETMTFPGAVGSPMSEGCNRLIRNNMASLITSAHDFMEDIGWTPAKQIADAKRQGVERQLFPDLTTDEKPIVDLLSENNDQHVNTMSTTLGISASALSSRLFMLEMKGIVRILAGNIVHLIN